MGNLVNELLQKGEKTAFSREKIFLEFEYPEAKDLLKHFLTLISASLLFSVTFSEKVIKFDSASINQTYLLLGSWTVFIVALGCCGSGLFLLHISAKRTLDRLAGIENERPVSMIKFSYLLQNFSGFLFGIGMVLTIFAGIFDKI